MFPFTGMYEKGTYVLSLNQVLNLFVLDVLFRPSDVKYVHILGMFSFLMYLFCLLTCVLMSTSKYGFTHLYTYLELSVR